MLLPPQRCISGRAAVVARQRAAASASSGQICSKKANSASGKNPVVTVLILDEWGRFAGITYTSSSQRHRLSSLPRTLDLSFHLLRFDPDEFNQVQPSNNSPNTLPGKKGLFRTDLDILPLLLPARSSVFGICTFSFNVRPLERHAAFSPLQTGNEKVTPPPPGW